MLTTEQLLAVDAKITGPDAAGYAPPDSIEDVQQRALDAGRRWATDLATAPELLLALDQFAHGPQAFIEAFAHGVNEVLQPLREMRAEAQQQAARDEQIRRRQAERAAEQQEA